MIEVALTTVTPVHAVDEPMVTVAPARNPVPVIVTFCRPATSPEVGVIAVTVGAGFVMLNVTEVVMDPEVDPVAVIVIVADDATVGVPEITPVDELMERPAGNAPVVTAYDTEPPRF